MKANVLPSRTRQQKKVAVLGTRVLSKADIEEAYAKPLETLNTITKIRDSHHQLARLLAAGQRPVDIAARGLYSTVRIMMLLKDPTFTELVEHYRGIVTAAYAEKVDSFFDLATANMVRAERLIADRLEETEDEGYDGPKIPLRDLLAISRDAADRFGHGKKQTNLNVNLDFAAKLERAIKRSSTAPTIEGEISSASSGSPLPDDRTDVADVSSPPDDLPRRSIRRI